MASAGSIAQLPGNGSKGSMRFKGLTLRSRAMRGGIQAQEKAEGAVNGLSRVSQQIRKSNRVVQG